MIALHTNNYNFDAILDRAYQYFDERMDNHVPSVPGVRRYTMNVSSALMPLAFNEIGIYKKTYGLNYGDTDPEYQYNYRDVRSDLYTSLHADYEACKPEQLGIIRVYTNDVNRFITDIANEQLDYLSAAPDAIQSLYNKCMTQVQLREGLTRELHTQVKLFKGKHMLLLVSDFSDVNQGSDIYLTIGLVPVLFKDWADKFNEEELNYFKELVRRSQVKRISNVKAEAVFLEAVSTKKYQDVFEEVKFKQTIERIVRGRIETARDTVGRAERQAADALQMYEQNRRAYYSASKILDNLEQTREDVTDEIKLALKSEGIVDVNTQGYSAFTIMMRTPVTFFDVDEVECYLHNIDSTTWLYQFFTDVFIDQKYKLYFVGQYKFDFDEQHSFNPPGAFSTGFMSQYNGLFNPHTWFFQCLGDYKPRLAEAFAKKDLLMYVNIALASSKSVNFKDGAVMNRWKEWLLYMANNYRGDWEQGNYADIKCLEDAEGNMFSLKEIYFEPVQVETAQETEAIAIEPHDIDEEYEDEEEFD